MEVSELITTPDKGDDLFLTAPQDGKNALWRYLILSVAPFLVSNFIGGIPLIVLLVGKSVSGELVTSGGMPDFSAMGINLNLGFALTVFPFVLAFLTFYLLIRPVNERSFRTVINGGRKIRWSRIFFSAAVWTIISGLYLYFSIKENPANFIFRNSSGSLLTLAVLAILLIPFQAGFEEVLFRGYLNQGFALWSQNRWVPIIATSVIFGLMHSVNPEVKEFGFLTMMPQYIFFGIVFSVLTMMDNGIELAIGAHTANNVFIAVFLTQKDAAFQTCAMYEQINIFPWKDFAGLVLMSLVFLAIMALVYRWRSVKKLYSRISYIP